MSDYIRQRISSERWLSGVAFEAKNDERSSALPVRPIRLQTVEALQREALEAEVRKLKVDNSLANRLFTTILSISAVLIAGSQMWMAYQQRSADRVRADRDESLKQIELHLRQVESGISLSQFAINQRALFLSADADEQIRRSVWCGRCYPTTKRFGCWRLTASSRRRHRCS